MPLHPMLVHFPIAFWFLGSVVLVAALIGKRESWWHAGWLLLIAATVCAYPAVLAGQNEFAEMAEQGSQHLSNHRDMGNFLPWPMTVLVLWYLHGRFSRQGGKVPKRLMTVVVLGVAGLIAYAASQGGHAVYGDGVGREKSYVQNK